MNRIVSDPGRRIELNFSFAVQLADLRLQRIAIEEMRAELLKIRSDLEETYVQLEISHLTIQFTRHILNNHMRGTELPSLLLSKTKQIRNPSTNTRSIDVPAVHTDHMRAIT